MRVQVLHTSDCPNLDETLLLVRQVADDNNLELELETREIRNEEEGIASRFQGSPTIQINGLDIEPDVRGRLGVAPGCRLYGSAGVPPRELVEQALLDREIR